LDGLPLYVRISSRFDELWFVEEREYGTIVSDAAPDPIAECIAKGWRSFVVPTAQSERGVLWKTPHGTWTRGALVLLHGGGAHHGHWCATSGTGNAQSVQAMNELSEQAVANGYAVFAVDSGEDLFSDALGFSCGKRFDFTSPADTNVELPFFAALFKDIIPSLRPAGSSPMVFLSGHSNGGYLAIRLASFFNDSITAFAPVAAGDPYGTTTLCEPLADSRPNAPGAYIDNETWMEISADDACFSLDYPNEAPWDGTYTVTRPPFRMFHHQKDPVVDQTCFDKATLLLQDNGYPMPYTPFVATGVYPEDIEPDPDANHFWQREYNAPLLDFFSGMGP
jgi:pimeloyl-ACP methyl ester carboxylesterase